MFDSMTIVRYPIFILMSMHDVYLPARYLMIDTILDLSPLQHRIMLSDGKVLSTGSAESGETGVQIGVGPASALLLERIGAATINLGQVNNSKFSYFFCKRSDLCACFVIFALCSDSSQRAILSVVALLILYTSSERIVCIALMLQCFASGSCPPRSVLSCACASWYFLCAL